MAKDKVKDKEALLMSAWDTVLKTGAGRDVLWDILEMCQLYAITNSIELASMARAEGERGIGLFILDQMQRANPESYITMQKEKIDA